MEPNENAIIKLAGMYQYNPTILNPLQIFSRKKKIVIRYFVFCYIIYFFLLDKITKTYFMGF
jgi:hypothetical protein